MNTHDFNDALQASLTFAQKNTSHIETQIQEIDYPEFDYASLVPVDFSAGEFTKSVTYYSMDGAGAARFINGNGKDIPTVGVSMNQHETAVYTAGIGYDYGWEEVNQARMLGQNLDSAKAMMAKRAYEEMTYNVALSGYAEKGMEGLFNYTGVPSATVTADGTGSSPLWSTKTGAQISRDINALLIGMQTATNQTQLADTLVLPTERFQYAATTQMSSASDKTILQFVKEANVYTAETGRPLNIVSKRGLLTAGASNSARMIAYRRSPEVLKMHIPMAHRFLPVQIEGLQFTIPGVFRLGGLDIRLPKAVNYGDGI